MTCVNGVVALALIGGELAQYISPELTTLFAYLGLAFPLIFVVELLFCLYWLLFHRWIRAAMNILLVAFACSTILLYLPIHRTQFTPKPEEGYIKILSLNANAFLFSKISPEGTHPTTDYLLESEADIICLQEARLYADDSPYMSERSLRRALPDYPYFSSAYAVKDHGSHLVVLSKYPIISTRPIDLHSDFNGGAVFTLEINGHKVILYNLHLESFRMTLEDRRQYLELVQKGSTQTLSKKLRAKMTPSFILRAKQVEQVGQDIHYQDSPYLLICGDFNDTPISYTHYQLSKELNDAIADAGVGPNYSYWLHNFIGLRIDHILYSDQIKVAKAYVDSEAQISDHKPIIAYFKLQE